MFPFLLVELFCLSFLLVVTGFSFQVFHPLMFGAGLLFALLMVSKLVMSYGSLFSFCLFMVMVGGVLVVFSYTISLIPFSSGGKYFGVSGKGSKGVFMKFGSLVVFSLLVGGIMTWTTTLGGWSETNFFSGSMYFMSDWSVCIVWLSLLLFLVMVFSVMVAGCKKGALVQ